jgi:hypothetical protein
VQRVTASLAVAAFAVVALAAGASRAHAQPGQTYESLKSLPDLAGAWTPLTPPFVLATAEAGARVGAGSRPDAICDAQREFKPEAVARCRQLLQTAARRNPCANQPAASFFTGRPPAGAGGAFEILYTPGRVTMAVESGLVRRIYLRDKPPAGALDESRSGTSLGRWEGSVLVVETTGLAPSATVLPGSVLGPGARVTERFSLVDANTLRIEATLTAPAVLAEPLKMQQQYRRARDRTFTDFDICVEGDRSFDRGTEQDQFDKTPPADLPPPPKE